MKKHKFKVGDVGFVIIANYGNEIRIQEVRLCAKKPNGDWMVNTSGDWYLDTSRLHPTPEACAQALVDEFYLTNPKT